MWADGRIDGGRDVAQNLASSVEHRIDNQLGGLVRALCGDLDHQLIMNHQDQTRLSGRLTLNRTTNNRTQTAVNLGEGKLDHVRACPLNRRVARERCQILITF